MKTPFIIALTFAAAITALAQTPNPSSPPPESPAEIKQKDALIAQLTPAVLQPGDTARGQQFFTQYCAICHQFAGVGKDFGPDLSYIGAFGPEKILLHIIDPNRGVNADFYTTTIESQSGEEYSGVITRDSSSGVTLHTMAGDIFVKADDIKTRTLTGRSLMPGGFESLGADTLRDIIAYVCAPETNYHILDLHKAFTADSRKGLWTSEASDDESLRFKKFGLVKEGDVPFYIAHPSQWGAGKNLILLKGAGPSQSYPQHVEVTDIGVKAVKLHFLGGIAAKASIGNPSNLPAAKITIHFTDGQKEEILLNYGQDIGDWKTPTPTITSADASNLLKRGQLYWFTKPLVHSGAIQSLTLESFDNGITPAFVAITAETSKTQ